MTEIIRNFASYVNKLPGYLDQLRASSALEPNDIKKLPGIYYFSEDGITLYVGRTKNMRQRYRNHCHPGSKGNDAPFAFKLARIETGKQKPSYKVEGSRKQLMEDELFKAAFDQSKSRIRKMELRFIEIDDPIEQTLFEVYASVELRSVHNDFATS
jgi:hypothetical protein